MVDDNECTAPSLSKMLAPACPDKTIVITGMWGHNAPGSADLDMALSLARALSRSRHGWVLDVPPCSGPNPVRAKKCTSLLLIDDTRVFFFLR